MSSATLVENVQITAEPDGTVDVLIPSNHLWDCVECFGQNRVAATYRFSPPNFVAHVASASPQRVQETLRDWKSRNPDE
ncbi:MAG TPA: hypothetical protein VH253_09045 [Phycisphaerae bacterium]|nr:hypothetical protein [Phycisphaerae bacterium]